MWDLMKYKYNNALIGEDGTRVTYEELNEAGEKLANVIVERCLVFCLCRNMVGTIVGYVSFLNNSIVPMMLNDNLDNELLYTLIESYKPQYLWVPDQDMSRFPDTSIIYAAYGFNLLKTKYDEPYPMYEELALLLTTSGSTGSPKFVRQSYINIYENAKSIVNYLELDENERPITTLPMNYTYGLSIINSHLLVGATILVTEKAIMQKDFWEFFKKESATSFGGVPYTYEMLDKLRFFKMNLPSLKTMTQAGGKLIPELHEKFAKYAFEQDKKFVVMYGQCEATARMGYLPSEKALEKIGSMGIAIPGGVFHLKGNEGEYIETPDIVGELVYEGKNVTLGYAEKVEDLIKGDERRGILETGDMAKFDQDGFYYIVGRKKRFLKIYGNRVNLDEIDRLIKGEFGIEVASSGVDDHLYIFITDDTKSTKVKEFIVNKTKLNQIAFKIIIIDEIPKNDSGKVLYKKLDVYLAHREIC